MFDTILVIHNLNRWLVLLAGVAAVGMALGGWRGGGAFTATHRRTNIVFVGLLDLQILLGLLMYAGMTDWVSRAMSDMGAAMKNTEVRFWAIEHITAMVIGAALIHIGQARSKRIEGDRGKHRCVALWFGFGILAMFSGIPWPYMPVKRPLWPFGR